MAHYEDILDQSVVQLVIYRHETLGDDTAPLETHVQNVYSCKAAHLYALAKLLKKFPEAYEKDIADIPSEHSVLVTFKLSLTKKNKLKYVLSTYEVIDHYSEDYHKYDPLLFLH